ncbi:MAG: DUF2804 domain-containing protein [Oscillospiraceae bacterium]|nr:DUF2804 domain-containing protein [Oscillospiraceae bacterium]
MAMQKEITTAGPLLDGEGRLAQRGYAKTLLLRYDRAAIRAGALRIKEWDYYIVTNGRFAVALTVADNAYMGLMSASLLDFEKPWEQTTSVMTFMPRGGTGLPPTTLAGDVHFENKRCTFDFTLRGGVRRLTCRLEQFKDKKPFSCALTLGAPPPESIVMATPYADDPLAFYYNQKINCMPASGTAEFDGRTYVFDGADSFGTLDWGRGVWTYANTWYWGSASGRTAAGEAVGFNIGYGFGDTAAATENAIFYKGRTHKLEQVTFNIPMKDKREDYLRPWTFTSSDDRFVCDFVPVLDRAACTDALIIKSDQHQVFGRFTGRLTLDGGEVLEIRDLPGFAEKVVNRW